MEYFVKSISEMEKIAKDFLKSVKSKDNATVIALYGNLGAGKTTFTQLVAKNLGIKELVSSPTFVIQKRYKIKKGALSDFEYLIHIDCYRLNNKEEILKLGFGELLNDPKNLILVEWPEKVGDAIPADHQKLFFEFIDDKTRKIKIG